MGATWPHGGQVLLGHAIGVRGRPCARSLEKEEREVDDRWDQRGKETKTVRARAGLRGRRNETEWAAGKKKKRPTCWGFSLHF